MQGKQKQMPTSGGLTEQEQFPSKRHGAQIALGQELTGSEAGYPTLLKSLAVRKEKWNKGRIKGGFLVVYLNIFIDRGRSQSNSRNLRCR